MGPVRTSNPIVSPTVDQHRNSAASIALPTDQTTAAATTGGAMTVDQFCKWACIGRTKFYSEVRARRITPRKIGSKTVIIRSEGDRYLNNLPVASAP